MRSYVIFRRYWDALAEDQNPINPGMVRLVLRLAADEAYELGLHQQAQRAPRCIWTIRDGKWASSTCENVETLTADQLPRHIYVGVTHCVGCGEIIGKVVWPDDVDPGGGGVDGSLPAGTLRTGGLMDDKTMLEVISDEQHKIWAHWMKYLFSVCAEADDGSMLIPKEKVDRWQRQMWTPYADLTNEEKESDRNQALKVLPALKNILLALSHFTERAEEAEKELSDLRIAYDELHKNNQYAGWKLLAQQQARAETAEAALAAAQQPCLWRMGDDGWMQFSCGAGEPFYDNGPYCPRCGRPVEVKP